MKKVLFMIAALAGVSNLSMYSDHSISVLDSSDYNWEHLDRATGESALSGFLVESKPTWESYNQWQCFPSDGIEMQCAEADYEGHVRRIPLIHVWHASHLYEFSMESEPEPDCDQVVGHWKGLLTGEDAFCVYAAYLQELEYLPKDPSLEGSLWIMNRLKTRKGYWSFDSDENYIRENESLDEE
jgi:hypothetical protein